MVLDSPDDWSKDVGTDGADEGVRFSFVEHFNRLQRSQGGAALSVSVLEEKLINPKMMRSTDQYLPVPLLQLSGGEDDGWQDIVQAAVLGHDVDVVEVSGKEEPQHDLVVIALRPVLKLHEGGHVDEADLGGGEGDGEGK